VVATLKPAFSLIVASGLLLGQSWVPHASGTTASLRGVSAASKKVFWASGTNGTSPGFVVMADDGNLLIYDGSGTPVWQSYTSGKSGAYMAVTSGGSVVVMASDGTVAWWGGTGSFW